MSSKSIVVAVMLLTASCAGQVLSTDVSDTGYEGTWQRGNEQIKSQLSIVKMEDGYRFRHSKFSPDGKVRVDCTWDGECEEFADGESVARYKFDASVNEATGRLRIECTGRIEGQNPQDLHYVDELVVVRKGKLLRAFRLLDNNGTYEFGEGPRIEMKKLSNDVLDPPPGWAPRGS